MKLSKLLSNIEYTVRNFADVEIDIITANSKETRENSLFFCIKGDRFDGHSFAKVAYDQGTRVFVVENEIEVGNDAIIIFVKSSRLAMSSISAIFFEEPSKDMTVIGITGTKGKTTTALMIKEILTKCSVPCGYIGSNGVIYKNVKLETENTTPDSLKIQSYLKMMREKGIKTVAIEVSSQALVQDRVKNICFDITAFTNLSEDHIGKGEHASFSDYKDAKKKLFTEYESNKVIANIDSKYTKEILSSRFEDAITFSTKNKKANAYADNLSLVFDEERIGTNFDLYIDKKKYGVFLPMPGEFNVKNALMAILVAKELGVPIEESIKVLSNIVIDGRFEVIKTDKKNFFIIDYAHNGLSLRSILESLRQYNPTRLISLFGSVGGRTEIRRREMGEVANELCDFSILTADNPDFENPLDITKDISLPFRYNDNDKYIEIADRKKAIEYAYNMSKKGDIILLAGKGHEKYQKYMGKREYFSEREILENLIKSKVQVGGNDK